MRSDDEIQVLVDSTAADSEESPRASTHVTTVADAGGRDPRNRHPLPAARPGHGARRLRQCAWLGPGTPADRVHLHQTGDTPRHGHRHRRALAGGLHSAGLDAGRGSRHRGSPLAVRRGLWRLDLATPRVFANRLRLVAGPALVGPVVLFFLGPFTIHTANPDEFVVPFTGIVWPWAIGAIVLSWSLLLVLAAVACRALRTAGTYCGVGAACPRLSAVGAGHIPGARLRAAVRRGARSQRARRPCALRAGALGRGARPGGCVCAACVGHGFHAEPAVCRPADRRGCRGAREPFAAARGARRPDGVLRRPRCTPSRDRRMSSTSCSTRTCRSCSARPSPRTAPTSTGRLPGSSSSPTISGRFRPPGPACRRC